MALSKETVQYVANLSRIELSDVELDKLSHQLTSILDFIDKLSETDISNVEPTSHILPIKNVLREDEPRKSLTPEQALANAPAKIESFFGVPKVIE